MTKAASILIVDDEQPQIAAVVSALQNSGYTVSTASDGFKALAACKVRLPDLILLDLTMPLMSGVDVFKRLRTEDKTRYIPVIFLRNREEAPPKLDKQTADDAPPVITKPFEPSDVVGMVKTMLSAKAVREELRKRDQQIKDLELIDPLTSFKNKRFLNEYLRTELAQCRRYNKSLSLIIIEPDQLKEVQKAHGARGIDTLFQQLAAILQRQNRSSDILVRLSSTELAIILTNTPAAGATEVAERLRETIVQSTFTFGDQTLNISASLGVCQFEPTVDQDGSILISHARAALSQARSGGGNVTLIAEYS